MCVLPRHLHLDWTRLTKGDDDEEMVCHATPGLPCWPRQKVQLGCETFLPKQQLLSFKINQKCHSHCITHTCIYLLLTTWTLLCIFCKSFNYHLNIHLVRTLASPTPLHRGNYSNKHVIEHVFTLTWDQRCWGNIKSLSALSWLTEQLQGSLEGVSLNMYIRVQP